VPGPAPELIGAAAHVFVDDLDQLVLGAEEVHHLARVLRLRPGEAVTSSDGAGHWRLCRWSGDGGVHADGPIVVEDRPAPVIAVGFSLVKGQRPEWAVQRLTEIGVDRILLLVAERSVVRWEGERAEQHVERLRRVARAAAMQSRRVWLPAVVPPAPATALLAELAEGGGAALAEVGGSPLSLDCPTVVVGPEGGWAEPELETGLPEVSLGSTVLRVETAAVVAGALLCALRGGVVSAR
jgi:16S rRNA (uracil1498-N3)-methyltransferase